MDVKEYDYQVYRAARAILAMIAAVGDEAEYELSDGVVNWLDKLTPPALDVLAHSIHPDSNDLGGLPVHPGDAPAHIVLEVASHCFYRDVRDRLRILRTP